MPDPNSGRRPLWRSLLRIATWVVSTLLVLCLLCYAILVAINWHDEELTPETQAWLTEPANPVPDAQNSWLAMQIVSFEKQSGPEAGRRFITAVTQVSPYDGLNPDDPPESTEQFMERSKHRFDTQFGPRWEVNPAIRTVCWNKGEWKGSLGRILAQRKAIESFLRANHAVLQRYYAAIALPAFFDLSPADYDLHYAITANQGDITAAACLARMDMSLRLLDGDHSAREPLQHHLRYWITQTTQSHSLTALMIASGQTKCDLDWATDLLSKVPASRTALLTSKPLWQDLADRSPTDLLSSTFPAELRSYQHMLARNVRRSPSPLQRLQTWLTYKPNATLNFRRQLMTESDDTHKQSCDWTSRHMAYNFSGKILSCIAATSMKNFYERLQTMRDMTGQLNQRLAELPTEKVGQQ